MGTAMVGRTGAVDARDVFAPTAVAALVAIVAGTTWTFLPTSASLLSTPLSVSGSMSASLLAIASYPAWSVSRHRSTTVLVFSGLLLLVAFSELLGLHHDVQAATGTGWQWFYFPAIAATLWCGRRAIAELGGGPGDWFLQAAGTVWVVGLTMEAIQWAAGEGTALHSRIATPKDTAEVIGSCLLFVALSIINQSRRTRIAGRA